jgi:3-deoxy-D-manno-octulosonate 8-phosphate phosphatase (KDO 8-P phosphatase)
MATKITRPLQSKFAQVKLFLCDVDGVLTDGSVFIGLPQEFKRFHIRDGLGLLMLRREGVKVGWISARLSMATTMRAEELKIDFLEQSENGKVPAIENILVRTGLEWKDTCFIGDDVVDLGAMKRAGVAIAVADAITEAREMADYVTEANGGHGAVREVVELILKAQNRWKGLVARHAA